MRSFDISASLGTSPTISNALGLAIDPNGGNIFLTTLSYGNEPNLWQFKPDGTLVHKSRVAIDLLTVPGNPGALTSATVGLNGHLFICVSKPVSANVFAFSVAEVSQDGNTVYSSFPDFIYTHGGSGITYDAVRQNLFLSSFADKIVYEVNLQGILTDRFSIMVSAQDIGWEASSGSVFVASDTYLGGTLLEYKKDAQGRYTRINVYSLRPLGTAHVLAFEINRTNGLFYLQDNNRRVVEFNKNELTILAVPAISGAIARQGLPSVNSKVTLQQALQPDQATRTDHQGAYSFSNAVDGIPFKVVIDGL